MKITGLGQLFVEFSVQVDQEIGMDLKKSLGTDVLEITLNIAVFPNLLDNNSALS